MQSMIGKAFKILTNFGPELTLICAYTKQNDPGFFDRLRFLTSQNSFT